MRRASRRWPTSRSRRRRRARRRARLRAVRVGRGEDRARARRGPCSGTRSSRATADGRRVALDPPRGLRRVRALPERARVDLRGSFREPTIVPGGFAERVRATGWVELPDVGRRCARDVRRAARLRAARGGARAPGARARRRERVHRAAVRGGAGAARRHGVRRRPAAAAGRARAGRAGRCGRAVRSRRRRDGAGGGRARRDGAALRRRGHAARGRRCTGAS